MGVLYCRNLLTCLVALNMTQFGEAQATNHWADRATRLDGLEFSYKVTLNIRSHRGRSQRFQIANASVTVPADFAFTSSSQISITRKGNTVLVKGSIPAYDANEHAVTARPILLYGTDTFLVSMGQTSTKKSAPQFYDLYPTSIPAMYGKFPANWHIVDGITMALLTGLDPTKLFGLPWRLDSDNHDSRLVSQNYGNDYKVLNTRDTAFESDILLHLNSAGQITSGEQYMVRRVPANKKPRNQWDILKTRTVNGVDVPEELQVRVNPDLTGLHDKGNTEVTWNLLKVTPASAPEKIPIPVGSKVSDWRLSVSEYLPGLAATKPADPVIYKWPGRLPTIDELKGIDKKRRDRFSKTSSPSYTLWLGIGSGILVLIGGVIAFVGRKRPRQK